MGTRKRKMLQPTLPMQRQLQFAGEGRHHNLQEIFERLNAKHFGNALRGYTITWGRKRRLPPKSYFIFGSIQEETRTIRIHPRLDQAFVPLWFIEYVVFHEMLHSVVPDKVDSNGRRLIHHEEFNKREQRFPAYRRAKKWAAENLARLLR